jgi:hypothetical protein
MSVLFFVAGVTFSRKGRKEKTMLDSYLEMQG